MEYNPIYGTDLIASLYRLVMAVRLHGDNNKIVRENSDNFIAAVRKSAVSTGSVSIKLSDNRFYVQDEKLPVRRENIGLIHNAIEFFTKREISGFLFQYIDDSVSELSVYLFARLLILSEKEEYASQWLTGKLQSAGISWIEVIDKPEITASDVSDLFESIGFSQGSLEAKKETGQKTYASALASIKGVAEKVSGKSIAGIRKTQRIVQKMVDMIIDDPSVLIGMSTIRDYDDYTYTHSVNVSILAMCLGLHIGLTRESVETLGICGLFHDLGKVEIPIEIIKKPGKLNAEETRVIEKHSLYSVTKILKLNAPRELKTKILLSPFEHHMKYDLSGYPRLNLNRPVSLFGKILTIVDVFDAITSPRSYRPIPFSPDVALGKMFERSGKDFDPILLKAFINMIGIYPVGTLLKLDTGELGLVSGRSENSSGIRPTVVVLKKDDSEGYKRGPVVSLEERDSETLAYRRNIVDSYHPGKFGIQPAQYLI